MNNFNSVFINSIMKKLAIIGATGLVGNTLLQVLQEEGLSNELELVMFVSDRSAGREIEYNGKRYLLNELTEDIINLGLSYAIFLTGEDVSAVWARKLSLSGVVVIDNSCAFRLEKDIPLLVPEINFGSIRGTETLIANPNCSTIQLVLVLNVLKDLDLIKKLIISSYQSVSGAGKDALADLENGTKNIFPVQIRNNFIASIGAIQQNGNCSEENKIINETQKILGLNVEVIANCVRVPVKFCHGENVYVEFESEPSLETVKKRLQKETYIKYSDDLFYPSECAGTNLTYVCRLRKAGKNGIQMFIIADNLRRGAAYNAVKILACHLGRK